MKKILWANRPRESLTDELIACFPSDNSNAYSLTRSEVDFLITELSQFHTKILDSLSLLVAETKGIDREASRVILRESVVLITYVFVDRVLRLNKILAKEGASTLSVAKSCSALPKTNVQLISLVDGSQEFNQYLLFRLASSIWQLETVSMDRSIPSDVKNPKPVSNLNFDRPAFLSRIKRKMVRMLSTRLGRIPALRLANIESALIDQGLYGVGRLMWLKPLANDVVHERKLDFREQLLPLLLKEVGSSLRDDLFFHKIGLDRFQAMRAAESFCELLLQLIPPDRLEGIQLHLMCEQYLKALSAPAILFCGMPDGESIHWIAAARKLHIPVIGVQHGAHYGFVNHGCIVELEFAYCDYFVSWGWKQFPKHPVCQNIRPITLPSPWLSERVKAWQKVPSLRTGTRTKRPHDVLLMSDRIQPFPPTINTLRMSRLDFLEQINEAISETVTELAKRRIRVLHKPFNYTSRDIHTSVLTKLSLNLPNYYSECRELDKGLNQKLLQSAWIVVWDEPGTGFFECLLGGIPTMLYWERLTCHEEEYARNNFKQLEKVGLLHTNVWSLAESLEKFLEAPEAWCLNQERTEIIKLVTTSYAMVGEDWASTWKRMVDQLAVNGEVNEF